MDDYPDPDEEYELMYADELDLLRDNDDNEDSNPVRKKALTAKRSLDFSSPGPKKVTEPRHVPTSQNNQIDEDIIEITPTPTSTILAEEPVVGTKRTVDELFGDINDIDFNEVNVASKKQKTDEEKDEELIHKILEGRRLRQMLLEPISRADGLHKTSYNVKDSLSLNIPRWNFMPLTNSNGDRVYVKLEPEDAWKHSLDTAAEMRSFHSTFTTVWEEAQKILESKKEQQTLQSQSQQTLVEPVQTKLWVDKYKPHSYIDLLSEEHVNKALLHWLHLWDKIVFNKEFKLKEPTQRNSFVKSTGQFQLTNKWKGKKEDQPEVDDDGRPHHKIALLCGPPGVGKTTLAHLLARLAGYRPVELNASDERSTEAFRTALLSATQMRSVIDAEKRPNCLVLDEIDGAPLPTVELLVRWCTATGNEGNAKKKTKTQPLKRPVIAICNDLYAPALRPLRSIALIIHVGGVTTRRLLSRLTRVCDSEGVMACARALGALAKKAQGDIRAAVLVLSFVASKGMKELKMEDVVKAKVGEKDCNKSVMQALQSVFTTKDGPDAFNNVVNTISAAGEYDRIIDGIFELYLTSRVDSRLTAACSTLDNLRTYDLINTWIQTRQNYALYPMLPMCAASCHLVLATRAPPKLRYPMQGQEIYRKRQECDSILQTVYRGVSPSVGSCSRRALLLDILPLLPHVIPAHIRSNNIQLCSDSERKALHTAASAMCDYGLQFTQQRVEDGTYAFVMQPDVYKLAFFGSDEKGKPNQAVRQTIAKEQQLEMIRRCEIQTGKVSTRSQTEAKSKSTSMVKDASLPNHLQRLKPKEIDKVKPQVHKDFFGRIVPIIESSQRTDAVRDLISSSSVFYQYQEGFNNAVRRSVRVRDLL